MNAGRSPRNNKNNKNNQNNNVNDAAKEELDMKLEVQKNAIVTQLNTELRSSEERVMQRIDNVVQELCAVKATIDGIEKRVTALEQFSIRFHCRR